MSVKDLARRVRTGSNEQVAHADAGTGGTSGTANHLGPGTDRHWSIRVGLAAPGREVAPLAMVTGGERGSSEDGWEGNILILYPPGVNFHGTK